MLRNLLMMLHKACLSRVASLILIRSCRVIFNCDPLNPSSITGSISTAMPIPRHVFPFLHIDHFTNDIFRLKHIHQFFVLYQ